MIKIIGKLQLKFSLHVENKYVLGYCVSKDILTRTLHKYSQLNKRHILRTFLDMLF